MIAPDELLRSHGGRYATALGIDLASPDAGERFKWFLAAMLYGARISELLASRTWHEFAALGLLTPHLIMETGWDGLVSILDAGGYTRYDYKTATKLLDACTAMAHDYGSSLDTLHDIATDPRNLEMRLKALSKGIGDITVAIFQRELRGIWTKADPLLTPLVLSAAQALGYLQLDSDDADRALPRLRKIWTDNGQPAADFADFEAALVREGLRLHHLATRYRRDFTR